MHKLYIAVIYFFAQSIYNQCQAQCALPRIDFSSCSYTPVGHRAYSAVYPENTLLAIEELFKRGIKYTEVDVMLTSDGRYVLFHDEHSLHRTTNGHGELPDFSVLQLQQLDAGSWRGPHFAGIKIPTLEQALLLAEKYDAHLYLDCKDYSATALRAALINSGVSPNRMLPSINSIANATAFRQLLPNTPWVWYSKGLLPDNVSDQSFYEQCVNLGCYAFEVGFNSVRDSGWSEFVSNVHRVNAKVWVFTINNDSILRHLVNNGIDGSESDRTWETGRAICDNFIGNNGFDSSTTGNWMFMSDLNATGVGSQLRPLNYTNPPLNQLPTFGRCTSFGIPKIGADDKVVMKVPKFDSANGLMVLNNFRVEDYGILDQSFTVLMDVYIPLAARGDFVSLYQTNTTNVNDADLFIDPNGAIGIGSGYHGQVIYNAWNRIVFTINGYENKIEKYLNGIYIGSSVTSGSRWAAWNSSRSGEDLGFLIFSDNDGETAELYCSAFQIRNYVLDSASIIKLGTVNSIGFAVNNADCWNAKLTGAIADSSILDYETQTWHFLVPADIQGDSATLEITPSWGATSEKGNTFKVSINNPTEWNIISQDSLTVKRWKVCVRKSSKPAGLSEANTKPILAIYPNPSTRFVNVETAHVGKGQLSIYSIQGIKIFEQNITGNTTLDLGELATGIYLIQIETAGGKAQQKIIKY